MWRHWIPVPAWTLALTVMLALGACSRGDEAATPTPTVAAERTAAAPRQPTSNGLCIPAGPLGVSAGATWSIAGPATTAEGSQQTVTTTITVRGFETGTWSTERGEVRLENSQARLETKTVGRSPDGQVLGTQEQSYAAPTISSASWSPVLTLDWDCHQEAWLRAQPRTPPGSVAVKHTLTERLLSSGVTVVLFTQTRTPDPSQQEAVASVVVFGYDKATGRLAVTGSYTQGTRDGRPYATESTQELVD